MGGLTNTRENRRITFPSSAALKQLFQGRTILKSLLFPTECRMCGTNPMAWATGIHRAYFPFIMITWSFFVIFCHRLFVLNTIHSSTPICRTIHTSTKAASDKFHKFQFDYKRLNKWTVSALGLHHLFPQDDEFGNEDCWINDFERIHR